MTAGENAERTFSVCPVCLKRLPALRADRGDAVTLERTCREHGFFSAPIWRKRLDFKEWTEDAARLTDGGNPDCPSACGLCASHIRDTCCVLLEVTHKCDLGSCRFCFAGAPRESEPTRGQISAWLRMIVRSGETFLQLSGGEPTTRDDLPEIVAEARRLGCKYIQLNSNGIRLAEEPDYAQALAARGLSFVFLQFDGVNDDIYRHLRGREMLELKERAIQSCGRAGIGVTLVPTVVRGVNDGMLGDIVRFGVARSPAVRGVHFQPACYLGRTPRDISDYDRITIDELLEELYRQCGSAVPRGSLRPSSCDHPLCGFHAGFVALEGGALYSLNRDERRNGDCRADASARSREFIGRRWSRPSAACRASPNHAAAKDAGELTDLDSFLAGSKNHSFTISGMAFQDAGNLDLERLASCSLHVFRDGAMVPFCARYLTPLAT